MAEGSQQGKQREPRDAGIPPCAVALVVCDAIWRDPGTGKRTILGCFSTIYAGRFPTVHPMLSVYAAVCDGHGKVPVSLRLIDVDEESPPLFELKGEATFADPRDVLEFDFVAQDVPIPAPGEYRLQLRSASHTLMERRIMVVRAGDGHGGGASHAAAG